MQQGISTKLNKFPQFSDREYDYRALFDNAAIGLAFIDCQSGCIIKANQHYCNLLGYQPEEMAGMGINKILHPDDFWANWSNRYKLERGDIRSFANEVRYRRKDRSFIWINVNTSAGWQPGQRTDFFIDVAEDISAKVIQRKILTRQAEYDQLTQLPNRYLFLDRLESALSRSRRHQLCTGLIYIDLDGFKPVNDSYGHHLGDLLLRAVSRRLLIAVRETDTVARIGGDEFAVIVEDLANRIEAETIIKKIRLAMNQSFGIGGETINIGISLGCAIYPDDTSDLNEMIKKADKSMYREKHSK